MAPITSQGEEDMTCGSVSDYDFRASAATPAWEVRSLVRSKLAWRLRLWPLVMPLMLWHQRVTAATEAAAVALVTVTTMAVGKALVS